MPQGTYSSGLGLTEPLRSGARGLQSRSPRSSILGDGVFSEKGHEGHKEEFNYYPAARRGYITDGVSPVESRSITPQGEKW